jgi:hypothetical protein
VVVELVLELVVGRLSRCRKVVAPWIMKSWITRWKMTPSRTRQRLEEVLHRFRRRVVEELELDRAVIGQHGGVCHASNPRYGLPRMGELPAARRDMCGDLA